MFFLDTNICVYHLKGVSQSLSEKILARDPMEIGIPAIVKGELYTGLFKRKAGKKYFDALAAFLEPFAIFPFGDPESMIYAEIRSGLEAAGTLIGPNDLIIAATAMARNATLVTHNTREFNRVGGLSVTDWTA